MYLHFLKSELYRASKLKCVYILLATLFVFTLFQMAIYTKFDIFGMTQEDVYELGEEGYSAEGMSEAFDMGFNSVSGSSEEIKEGDDDMLVTSTVVTITDDNTGDTVTYDSQPVSLGDLWGEGLFYNEDMPTLLNLNVAASYHFLALAIFTGIFLGSAYRHGYDKNLIVSNNCRFSLFLARITVIAIYTLTLLAATFIFTAILDALFTGGVTWNLDAAVWGYMGLAFLLAFAFALVVAAVASFTRNTAASLTVGVLLSCGFLSIGLSIATILLKHVFPDLPAEFNLIDLTLTQNAETLTLDSSGKEVLRALLCSLIYGASAIVSSGLVIKRRDIS
jgi:ABC-type transport system involved in multi-copper enzyme maturation permease subunit